MSEADKIVAALLVLSRDMRSNSANPTPLTTLRDQYYEALVLLAEGQGSARHSS